MAPEPPKKPLTRFGPIVRDVALIFVLNLIGGFIAAVAANGTQKGEQQFLRAILLCNLSFGTLGFTISACLAPGNRWRHLHYVGLGVWLTGLINVVFAGIGIGQWVLSLFVIFIMEVIGGAISYAFKRDSNPST
ncbi:hypothetical protein Cflav_PD2067 [Pedosphaera parvula Ellin514]|uniref:Uncharacterized protein n=2 Tax=Pedosphaera TaxID=1032526 RepID=B9XMH6_PEDPL|nr:hypothetical protein Cflav_PD2067 [Pedosphaera parvula Ellin514]